MRTARKSTCQRWSRGSQGTTVSNTGWVTGSSGVRMPRYAFTELWAVRVKVLQMVPPQSMGTWSGSRWLKLINTRSREVKDRLLSDWVRARRQTAEPVDEAWQGSHYSRIRPRNRNKKLDTWGPLVVISV